MNKIIYIFLILVNYSCNQNDYKENNRFEIKKNLSDFSKIMTTNDTVIIYINLTMEWWIRVDKVIVTKFNNLVYLETDIEESYEMNLNPHLVVDKLKKVSFQPNDVKLEKFFTENFYRTKINTDSYDWLYKIINKNDTITFYSEGLSDKGKSIKYYYEFMLQFYPNDKHFIYNDN